MLIVGQTVPEAVMVAMETRQEEEMDLLMALLESCKTDKTIQANNRGKSDAVSIEMASSIEY